MKQYAGKRLFHADFERLPEQSFQRRGNDNAAQIDAYKRVVRAAMDKLTDVERRHIEMYYFRGYKYREIAEILGISVPSVSKNMTRAKKKLTSFAEVCEKSGLLRLR